MLIFHITAGVLGVLATLLTVWRPNSRALRQLSLSSTAITIASGLGLTLFGRASALRVCGTAVAYIAVISLLGFVRTSQVKLVTAQRSQDQ